MKKLSLNVDELTVSSFDAGPLSRGEGTVEGQELLTRRTYCYQDSCEGTCDPACVI